MEVNDNMNNTYKDRKKSYLIKWLMEQDNMPTEVAAEALGVSLAYFNNKLSRNSFSFEDIIRMAYATGYELQFIPITNEDNSNKDHYTINTEWYFPNEKLRDTLKFIRERNKRDKLQQYYALKAELKERYGFED